MGFKHSIFLLAIVVLVTGILIWCRFSADYYSVIAVTCGRYGHPLITAQLQDQSCTLAVRIGSRFPLFLQPEMLNKIDKHPQGTVVWHNIEGQECEASSYLIPELKVGGLTLKNIVAYQSEENEYGILGKLLGGEFNLLVDFPHSRIVACDTFTKLQAKKLAGADWIRIPIETDGIGIILRVNTDFGICKLAINTTSRPNLLSSSFVSSEKPVVSSSFVLGGQQFGNVRFESIDLPEGLREIDGFIGMDFLKEHALYLDYTHKIAYVEPVRKYFERIPVTFANSGDPIMDVSVEDNIYPLFLDLGSGFPFTFQEEILQNMSKFNYGIASWYDFTGKKYEAPIYTIPEIKMNNLRFTHVLANQDKNDIHIDATQSGFTHQYLGHIGLPILEKFNLFLDFPHSAMYASTDHLLLQQAGLLSDNLLVVPFTLHPDGIFLSVATDTETYQLMLDTGASHTAMRAPCSTFTSRFCMMGHDFGECSVRAINLSPQFDFDGYLGMDFLRKFSLFIDYSNRLIYIDLQKGSSQTKTIGL